MQTNYYRIKIPAGRQIGQEYIKENLVQENHDFLFLNLPRAEDRIHARVVHLPLNENKPVIESLAVALVSVTNMCRAYLGEKQQDFFIFIAPVGDGRDFVISATLEEYVPSIGSQG